MAVVTTRGLAFVALAVDALAMILAAGSLPGFAAAYHVPQDVAGLVFTANGLGFVVALPASGLLADRYGKRTIGALSALVLAGGLLLFAVSGNLATGLCAAALTGAGAGSVESLVTALLPELYPGREGFANNFAQAFFSVGATLGPLLLLPIGLGWRLRLALCGLAFLPLAAGLWGDRPRDVLAGAAADAAAWRRGLAQVLRARGVGASLAALVLYTGVEIAVWGWLFAVVTRPGGAGPVWAVAELSGFWCAMGVGRLASGALAERMDLGVLIAIETAVGIPALVLALLQRSPAGALAAVMLCGLAFAGIWPSLVGNAQKRHGQSAFLAALLVGAGGAGSLVIPAAFGFATARWGLAPAALGLAGLLLPVIWLPRAGAAGPRPVPVRSDAA